MEEQTLREPEPLRLNKKTRKRIARLAKAVQEEIQDCGCVQPAAEGEVFWVHSSRTQLDDLMAQHDVPEELYDLVAERLECPACDTKFNRYSDVGVEWGFEYRHRMRIAKAADEHEAALQEFAKRLQDAKSCNALHPMAR